MGRYYLTDESGINNIWQFQGNTLATFPTAPAGVRQGPIVVDGNTNTVRAVAGGFSGGDADNKGSTYDFAGNVLGPLNLDFSAHATASRVIDAGFDGTHSYIVDWNGGVYRYAADFSGPGTFLFNTVGATISQGITYDTTTNTIWTSDYDFGAGAIGGAIRQWDMAGNQISMFRAADGAGNFSERNTALAYDFSDDTFWMNAHVETGMGFGRGELWQFSRNGTFLQKIHGQQLSPNAPRDILYWGGEIFATGEPSPVPEPGTYAMFGLALAGYAIYRRRRAA